MMFYNRFLRSVNKKYKAGCLGGIPALQNLKLEIEEIERIDFTVI
jgi:hypothetical protein